MLLYSPFCSISPHFSLSKLFGSPLFQRHGPGDVPLTQAILSFNQLQVWDPSTVFRPINQRPLFGSLVKFMTKCHSFSVSIETSELFSWWPHLSLAVLQSVFSPWKEYLEQTETMRGRPIKEKKYKQENGLFTFFFNCLYHSIIRRCYTEGELNKTLGHTQELNTHHSAVGIGWTKLWISKIRSLHKSKTPEGVASTFPSPWVPCLRT